MRSAFVFVSAIMVMGATAFGAGGDMGAGTDPNTNGSAAYPYLIEDLVDFDTFAGDPNYWASGVHTKLACDPNLTGRTYTTAVIAPDGSDYFQGIFDGDGFCVSNLTIDTAGANNWYLGLFGLVKGSDTEIKNLGIENGKITGGIGSNYLGGLCGRNGNWDTAGGAITNCYATGSVNGNSAGGGLCGYNQGTINNCYASGLVTGGDSSTYLGGLCGRNSGTITNCYSTGSVNGNTRLGGLCGYIHIQGGGTIANSYSTGSVTGDNYLGGLCGVNYGAPITNCYATGAVTGDSYLGGLCGWNNATPITNCYATGAVTGDSYLGGLCGTNAFGTITNCYSTGSVTGDSYLGGLCGINSNRIINCYSTGSVNGITRFGGLCGYQHGNNAEISNCYWNTVTSDLTAGYNLDPFYPGTITNVVGKTTSEMQTGSTFSDAPASWDFVDTWWINDGRDYPKLYFQPFGDLDNDSHVNLVDFAVMSAAWETSDGDVNYNSVCELSGDTTINMEDMAELAEMWLEGPRWYVGDINDDYRVDLLDMSRLSAAWLAILGEANWDADCDLYADGSIDILDLQVLVEHWLEGVGP